MAHSDTIIIRKQIEVISALRKQIELGHQNQTEYEKIVISLNDQLNVAADYIEQLKAQLGLRQKTENDLFEELAHAVPLDTLNQMLEPKEN